METSTPYQIFVVTKKVFVFKSFFFFTPKNRIYHSFSSHATRNRCRFFQSQQPWKCQTSLVSPARLLYCNEAPRTTAHTERQQYFQMFQKLEMLLSLSARWLERGQRSKAYLVTGPISTCLEGGLSDRCSTGEQEMLRSDLLRVNSHVIYGYGCSGRSPAGREHSAKANLGNVYQYNTCTKMSYCKISLYDA